MSHQVFIERCRDGNPETAMSLAKAIAERYGIDPEQILGRLKQGRFQVKANLDLSTARTFMSYLETQGALCSIVAADGEIVVRSSELSTTLPGRPALASSVENEGNFVLETPDPLAKTHPPGLLTVEPEGDFVLETPDPLAKTHPPGLLTLQPEEGEADLSLMTPPPPDTGGSDYESGLSAGFSSRASSQDLGALGDSSAASSGSLLLETLDGTSQQDQEAEPNSSVAEITNTAAFLPPDMLDEPSFELDVDPPTPPPRHDSDPSVVDDDEPASSSSSRLRAATGGLDEEVSRVSKVAKAPAAPTTPPHIRALRALGNHERLRFAVGIMLAVFVGFTVVSLVASSREATRYSTIIAELRAQYDAADTSVAWDALDGARATTVENLSVRRRNIVIMSVFLWLIVGGIFAFLWIRVYDWSRWEEAAIAAPVRTPAPS